jgi:hypothetical protein
MIRGSQLPPATRELCALLGYDPHALFPDGTSDTAMQRLFAVAVRDGDFVAAAGGDVVVDGFRRVKLADQDFGNLRRLVSAARRALREADAQIEHATERKQRIAALLEVTAP